MRKKTYNLLLALASTSPMALIFAVNTQNTHSLIVCPSTQVLIALLYVGLINALGFAPFFGLSKDSIEGDLKDLELVNSSFLPNYLGYFFVAVSITKIDTFLLVYNLTVVLVMLSQSMYYNPLLLVFRYNFYHATDENGTRIFLITKRKIRTVQAEGFPQLRRISDVTYIEL